MNEEEARESYRATLAVIEREVEALQDPSWPRRLYFALSDATSEHVELHRLRPAFGRTAAMHLQAARGYAARNEWRMAWSQLILAHKFSVIALGPAGDYRFADATMGALQMLPVVGPVLSACARLRELGVVVDTASNWFAEVADDTREAVSFGLPMLIIGGVVLLAMYKRL